jgi:hypothetical protein
VVVAGGTGRYDGGASGSHADSLARVAGVVCKPMSAMFVGLFLLFGGIGLRGGRWKWGGNACASRS